MQPVTVQISGSTYMAIQDIWVPDSQNYDCLDRCEATRVATLFAIDQPSTTFRKHGKHGLSVSFVLDVPYVEALAQELYEWSWPARYGGVDKEVMPEYRARNRDALRMGLLVGYRPVESDEWDRQWFAERGYALKWFLRVTVTEQNEYGYPTHATTKRVQPLTDDRTANSGALYDAVTEYRGQGFIRTIWDTPDSTVLANDDKSLTVRISLVQQWVAPDMQHLHDA